MEKFGFDKLAGKRQPLAPRIPLEMPLAISFMTSNVCNIKCHFCSASLQTHKHNKSFMNKETFVSAVDNIKISNWKSKQIFLTGLGEPLLNKDIVFFISYLKDANIAQQLHIISNGILLTNKLSDQLIENGLDVMRISINGLSDKDYAKYTSTNVNFEQLVDNITYYYKHKRSNQKVYIKIMKHMIDTDERREYYLSRFQSICDVINIEQVTELFRDVVLDSNITNPSIAVKGGYSADTNICPLPFYNIVLNADGTISACCMSSHSVPPSLVMGDLTKITANEIWSGSSFRKLWVDMLSYGKDRASEYCKNCKVYKSYTYAEDLLDDDKDRILATLLT